MRSRIILITKRKLKLFFVGLIVLILLFAMTAVYLFSQGGKETFMTIYRANLGDSMKIFLECNNFDENNTFY